MSTMSYHDVVESEQSQTSPPEDSGFAPTPPASPATRKASPHLNKIESVGSNALQGDEAAINHVLQQSMDLVGDDGIPEELPPQEKERGFFGSIWEGIKSIPNYVGGAVMYGPAQFQANVLETAADFIVDPQNTEHREYTQYGETPAGQAGTQLGATLTPALVLGGIGFFVGGPPGSLLGASIGYGISGFVQPPSDGNVLDAAQAMGINVGDGLSRYTYKPDDPALINRNRNAFTEGVLEVLTGGSLGAITGAIKNRRSLDAVKRVYKNAKRDFADAKDKVLKNEAGIIERELTEGPRDGGTLRVTEDVELPDPIARAVKEAPPGEVIARHTAQDEHDFDLVLKRKVEDKAVELEKKTGRAPTPEETISALEDEAVAATRAKKTTVKKGEAEPTEVPLDFSDDNIDALTPGQAARTDKHIDDTLPPSGNTIHDSDTRKATVDATYAGYKLTTPMGDATDVGLYEKALNAGKKLAGDSKQMARIFAKHKAGRELTLNEHAAIQVWSFEQYRTSGNIELFEKVAAGTATDAEILAFKESAEDLVSMFASPYFVDAQVASDTGSKLGIRGYIKDWANAGGDAVQVTPQAKMAAIKNVVEMRGGRVASQKDAEAIIRWALSSSPEGAASVDALKGVTPRDRANLATSIKKALTAKTPEELGEELTSIGVRSWGRTLSEGVTSYMTNNMLNGHSTILSIAKSIGSDFIKENVANYLRPVGQLVIKRDLFGARRDLKRANAYSAALIRNFRAATKESYLAFKDMQGGRPYTEYHLGVKERTKNVREFGPENPDVENGSESLSFIKNGFMHVRHGFNTITGAGSRVAYSFDVATSHLVENARYAAEAAYEGMERVRAGELKRADLDKFIANPPPEIIAKYSEAAQRDAKRMAYRGELELDVFRKLMSFAEGDTVPARSMRLVSPFLRPTLIGVERTMEFLPGLNKSLPYVREALEKGGSEAAQVHARAASGTLAVISGMFLSREGILSGPGEHSAMFDDEGKRIPPHHMRIGDKWYPIEQVFGNGVVAQFMKMASNLDYMFDKATDENWEALRQGAILTLAEMFTVDRIGDIGFLMESVQDLASGKIKFETFEQKDGKRFVQRFLPFQRLARDIMGDGYESEVVVGGETALSYYSNLLDQTWREAYAPTTLANKPNYFGESAKRRSTFHYSWDHYTSADEAEEDVSPLKVLRDLKDYADSYKNIGAAAVSEPEWPKVLEDPLTKNPIRLTPELYNMYQQAVSGYNPVTGSKLPGLYRFGNPMDFRETIEAIYKDHTATLHKLYKGEPLPIDEFNVMITQINNVKQKQHARAKELILQNPKFKDIAEGVAQAKRAKEAAIQGIIDYGG